MGSSRHLEFFDSCTCTHAFKEKLHCCDPSGPHCFGSGDCGALKKGFAAPQSPDPKKGYPTQEKRLLPSRSTALKFAIPIVCNMERGVAQHFSKRLMVKLRRACSSKSRTPSQHHHQSFGEMLRNSSLHVADNGDGKFEGSAALLLRANLPPRSWRTARASHGVIHSKACC